MSVRTAPIYPLLAGALLLAAGCASSPPGHGAGHGQGGGAGSPAPSASPAGSTAPSDAAKPDPAGAGAGSAGGGTGSAQTSGPDGPGQTSDEPSGTHRRGDASRRRDTSGDLKSEKASKKPDDNAGNGASAREIPDGSDDDVVARRLRQAAEQETDPELKEKLWQEYIDYKRNAQGK